MLDHTNAQEYVITGLPDSVDRIGLHQALAKSRLAWSCKPLFPKRGVNAYTSTWHVLAPKGRPPAIRTCTLICRMERANIQINIDKKTKDENYNVGQG